MNLEKYTIEELTVIQRRFFILGNLRFVQSKKKRKLTKGIRRLIRREHGIRIQEQNELLNSDIIERIKKEIEERKEGGLR